MAEDEIVANQPTPHANVAAKGSHLDLIRVILDFIAKCLYPGIAIALLILLYPALQHLDAQALLGRLQSAKAGDYEFTFSQAEKVGAETAPLNRKVTELELVIASLRSEVGALQNKVGTAPLELAKSKEISAQEKNFKANAQYVALVFHRRESRASGEVVTKALLNAGFVSSDTETDFSELQKVTPTPGVIYITYNTAGGQVLSDVKNRIEKLGLKVEVKTKTRRPANSRLLAGRRCPTHPSTRTLRDESAQRRLCQTLIRQSRRPLFAVQSRRRTSAPRPMAALDPKRKLTTDSYQNRGLYRYG